MEVLIAVAIAPIAYPILRWLLRQANNGLYRVFPDGKLKRKLFDPF